MGDAEKVARLRGQLPAVTRSVYLNTGSVGPLPTPAFEAMTKLLAEEHDAGRIGPAAHGLSLDITERARRSSAALLGVAPEEIALTHLTTEGINIALWAVDWGPDEEIITTNIEHPAVLWPTMVVAHRCGAQVKVADVANAEDIVAEIEKQISPRTRLIAFSHVAFCTGGVLPAAEIIQMARRHGVLTLVDGAQAAGALPLNLQELGADFYAVPGQKWLCGPEDTGVLYVRRERLPALHQTFVGYASMAPSSGAAAATPHPDARRFEIGSRHCPSLLAQAVSAEWLRDEVGMEWAHERIARLVAEARQALADLPGVQVLTPTQSAGLLCFTVEGIDPEQVVLRLNERGIIARWIKEPRCVRISLGFFNTEDDIDRLVEGLRDDIGLK
jgi:L-cysteine/cystine lyase